MQDSLMLIFLLINKFKEYYDNVISVNNEYLEIYVK